MLGLIIGKDTPDGVSDGIERVFTEALLALNNSIEFGKIDLPNSVSCNEKPPYWCVSPLGLVEATTDGAIERVHRYYSKDDNEWYGNKDKTESNAVAVARTVHMARRGYAKFDICNYGIWFDGKRDDDLTESFYNALDAFGAANSFDETIQKVKTADDPIASIIAGAIAEAYYGIPEPTKRAVLRCLTPEQADVYARFEERFDDHERYRLITKYIGLADRGRWVGLFGKGERAKFGQDAKYWKQLSDLFRRELSTFGKEHPDESNADYRALVDFCARKRLNRDLLRTGEVMMRLKALKSYDIEHTRSEVVAIECATYVQTPPYSFSRFLIDMREKSVTRTSRGFAPKTTRLDDSEFCRLKAEFEAMQIEFWGADYIDRNIIDGGSWSIKVRYVDGRRLHIPGANAYPDAWNRWVEYISEFTPPTTPEVSAFALEVTTTSGALRYRESVDVHSNGNALIYKQKHTADASCPPFDEFGKPETGYLTLCDIKHRHALSDAEIMGFLVAAADVIQSEPWVDEVSSGGDTVADNDRACSRFAFTAAYYDSRTFKREGWYNRRSVDASSFGWREFLGKLRSVINQGFPRYILDKEAFMDAPRPGEERYVSVGCDKDTILNFRSNKIAISHDKSVVFALKSYIFTR